MIAAHQERLGAFQIGRGLYPDFQIPGAGVADLTHVPREPLFQGNGRRIELRPNLQIFVMELDAGEVPKPSEGDVVLQFLHLHIVAECQQKRLQRFPNILQGFRPDDSFNRPDGGLFFLGPFALKRAPLIRHCGTSPDQFQQQQIASIPPISQQFDIPGNLQLLKKTRQDAMLTQAQLARKIGETQTFISKCERGERRIDVVELDTFCRAFGVSLKQFVGKLERAISRAK